jgi:hypothetical protein
MRDLVVEANAAGAATRRALAAAVQQTSRLI